MAAAEPPWVVARIRPQFIVKATINIARQGAEHYAPRGMMRSPRTNKLTAQPIFPGYVFVRHPEGRWSFLNGTFGVLGVIMGSGECPAYLSHADVEKLRRREGKDGLIRMEAREFDPGERVHIERGAVTLDAIVEGMAARDRVYVLLGILGGVRTEVDVRDISRG